jgi:hypothetical protein
MSMTETCIMDGMTSAKFFDTMGKRIRILREDQGLNQTEAAQGSRRQRLLDVIANGPAILRAADPTAANAWLRAHLRVWLKDKEVVAVEWL